MIKELRSGLGERYGPTASPLREVLQRNILIQA